VSFHLGKPILAMLVVAVLSGSALLLRPGRQDRPHLLVWVFADAHASTYRGDPTRPATRPSLLDQFVGDTGLSARVDLISYRAMNVRLIAMYMADLRGPELPDIVEVEISQVGKYFRPPLSEIGFLPLNHYLQSSGWIGRLSQARLKAWSKDGVIFGVPHDVHPMTITYRHDLFAEAGVDLESSRTWREFHDNCLRFQDYWRSRGEHNRLAMELPKANASLLVPMLLQRRVNLVDADGKIHINDPRVAQTLALYASMVAGPREIGGDLASGDAGFSQDLATGKICAIWTPDWRVAYVKQYAPMLAGKLRMMPLPVFEDGDHRTSTWGGTMMGISRNCPDPDAAWKLVEWLYFSREGIEARRQYTDILPPVVEMWDDPYYQQPDAYFGGQKIGQLYVDLARNDLPERHVTPSSTIAESMLSYILTRAVSYARSRGEAGLREQCQQWLDRAAADLADRIRHGRFEEADDAISWQP